MQDNFGSGGSGSARVGSGRRLGKQPLPHYWFKTSACSFEEFKELSVSFIV